MPVDVATILGPDEVACWIEPARPCALDPAHRVLAAIAVAAPPAAAPAAAPAPAPAPAPSPAPAPTPTPSPAPGPATNADADAPGPPSLRRSGRKTRRATGQSFRALGLGATYQRDSSGEGATDAELSLGVVPDGAELGGVEVGAEVLAAGALAGSSFDSGTAGVHGWVSPGRLTLALYAVGGVAGESPPEHTGANPIFQGSAGVEYEIGPSDTPWLTVGGTVQLGVQSHLQIGDPEGASTYLARALTLGGVASASLTLLYGAPGSAAAAVPRLEVWSELAAARTGGDRTFTSPPVGPAVLRPTGERRELVATTGITVNVPIAGSGHRVLSAGVFGGVHPQRDTIGGASESSAAGLLGASLGYAGRF